MRSQFLAAAVSAFALTVLASPIPQADRLRAEGRSEHEILAELGARHPTPSLGEADVLSTSIFQREPSPEPIAAQSAVEDAETKAIIQAIINNTLTPVKRGLAYLGLTRSPAPEPEDAYAGMELEYRQPKNMLRLRA